MVILSTVNVAPVYSLKLILKVQDQTRITGFAVIVVTSGFMPAVEV